MGLPSLNHPQGSVSPTPSHPGADPSSTKGLHLPDMASSCHPAGGSGPWAASLPSLHRHPCGWGLMGAARSGHCACGALWLWLADL